MVQTHARDEADQREEEYAKWETHVKCLVDRKLWVMVDVAVA